MQSFLHVNSDAVNALDGGKSKAVLEAIASTVDRITSECAQAYPE
jgi:hypothetical protein